MTTLWCEHPIHRLATAIDTREVSVREVVDVTLARIADRVTVLRDGHRVACREAEGFSEFGNFPIGKY
mgnify:CR=1 FL=1